jgi:glycosyltransferase involved in cell wall biosynthesis
VLYQNKEVEIDYSFIIPVYNRPDEIDELLSSLSQLTGNIVFEVVIVEDGSKLPAKAICDQYQKVLDISYYSKANSGPGASRNFGMERAKGNYFLILDSDCILPSPYLQVVDHALKEAYVDCFGGPDAAHDSFTPIQKAIDFVMTSFLTTGGIRGKKGSVNKFQPRSFNMGLSKKAFEATKGFGKIHPGEDPDLSIRLWKANFKTKLIPEAYVFHKRRISWKKFFIQVNKFGLCRPILNHWHPHTKKLTYWFPSLFSLGLLVSLFLFFVYGTSLLLICYALYFFIVALTASIQHKNIIIGFMSLWAVCIQFFGYGYGFLKATLCLKIFHKSPQEAFPKLFFN